MDEAQFAATRSHQDSQTTNDNARAAAQAAILINGGAATAILTFLAKGTGSTVPREVAFALIGYAFGVVLGASMYFLTAQGIEKWAYFWECRALMPQNPQTKDDNDLAEYLKNQKEQAKKDGMRLNGLGNACFWGSTILFALSTLLVAKASL